MQLVTGGTGFIGSHLVEELLKKDKKVIVIDNFSSGKIEFIKEILQKLKIKYIENKINPIIEGDKIKVYNLNLLNKDKLFEIFEKYEIEFIWHLAAEPNVRLKDPDKHFLNNVVVTKNILDGMRKYNVKYLAFTSSSTVYGEANKIPTPEDYGPLLPISYYGGSKLAAEALIISYAYENEFKCWIFRLANIIGERLTHGVIFDFVVKLLKNHKELEILGDGTQRKSYLYVKDCIEAMMIAIEKTKESKNLVEIFNIGSNEWISVKEIADIICEELKVRPEYKFINKLGDGRGWKGDVKTMMLDIKKLENLGWKPKVSLREAIRFTVRDLLKRLTNL